MNTSKRGIGCASIVATLILGATNARAAQITIVNKNDSNEGFNDPTTATPVGGNAGTTVGQQRLLAFKYAAAIWGAALDGNIPVSIESSFVHSGNTPGRLTCTPNSGALGGAAPAGAVASSNFPRPSVWYPLALANQFAGRAIASPNNDVIALFNADVGSASCLTGDAWYYGLDRKAGSNEFDLVAVVLHEFGHGLGFLTLTNTQTGAQLASSSGTPFPDVWEFNMYDLAAKKHWNEMTNLERLSSAANPRKLVWDGAQTTANTPTILKPGVPSLAVLSPDFDQYRHRVSGEYMVGTAQFGPDLTSAGISGVLTLVLDSNGSTTGCVAPVKLISGSPPFLPTSGGIALIDRGQCAFSTKVKNAQRAGASAVVITDDGYDLPPAQMAGSDPSIIIASVHISHDDGTTLKIAMSGGPVQAMEHLLGGFRGADDHNHLLLYTPHIWKRGSSVSHADTLANVLMDPAYATPTHDLDLTANVLQDIGWSVSNPRPPATSADLAISIQGQSTRGNAGFNVTVTNNGPDAAPEVEVSQIALSGGTLGSISGDCAPASLPCALGTMPAGTSKSFTATYSPASPNAIIQITLNVAAPAPDPVLGNNRASASGTPPPKSSGGCAAAPGSADPVTNAALLAAAMLWATLPKKRGRELRTSPHSSW